MVSSSSMSSSLFDSESSSEAGESSDDLPHVLKCQPVNSIAFRTKRTRDASKRCSSIIVPKKDAPWQRMLDMNEKGGNTIQDETSSDGKYFRRRFRMPFVLFKVLIEEMLKDNWFPGFGPGGEGKMSAIRLESNRGASLQVMVLSSLRVLGRGNAFDECFDGSGCKEECIRTFFHRFCPMLVSKLMPSVVRPPLNAEEVSEQVRIYQRLGMGGAIGSTDCTHFTLGKCSDKIAVLCTGKEGFPTLAYSMTSSHSRKILHCSAGFFGSRNDKTISKHDSLIDLVRTFPLYTQFEWKMNVDELNTKIVKGVFLLCDGGYHKWAQLICPLKHTSRLGHTLWSCQLESVRKDIECTFGVLKVRFKVLQYPLPYMAKDWNAYRGKIDNIVWTCCVLHNLLLRHDGLEFLWTKADYLSVWYTDPDAEHREDWDGPPVTQRAQRRFERRLMRGGEGSLDCALSPAIEEEFGGIVAPDLTPTEVEMGHVPLREALVRNFEVLWKKKQVHWLKYPNRKTKPLVQS
jgi:hypothetical protein